MRSAAILAALPAALYELAEQAAFRLYMADTLFYHGEGKRLTTRYSDLFDGDRNKPPSEEEINAMAARMGSTVTEE